MAASPFQVSKSGTVRRSGASGFWALERSDSGWGNQGAFAAISRDGQVVVWGDPASGGILNDAIRSLLTRQDGSDAAPWIWTVELASSSRAFAARRANGEVMAWGDPAAGGVLPDETEPDIQAALRTGVMRLFGLAQGFAALKDDGSLVTWGPGPGSSIQATTLDLSKPYQLVTSFDSVAILQGERLVGCWGGGAGAHQWQSHDALRRQLSRGVLELTCNDAGFAARTDGGQVITGGCPQESAMPAG